MRGSLWLLLISACWTGSSEPAAPRSSADNAAGRITCKHYWAHIDDVFGMPAEVRASVPITQEDCVEFDSFTDEQQRCFLSATTQETMSLCAIPDAQQRAEARKMLPIVKREWPGTATPDAVRGAAWRHRDTKRGCAFLGIAPRPDWRNAKGVLVGFLLRDSTEETLANPVTATLAPSIWTCVVTDPAGMCHELERRCGPNASPE